MRLENKVAVVTGAGSGIGRAAALRFAREGARIAAADRDRSSAEETAELARKLGAPALAVTADIAAPEDVAAAIARAQDAYGRIDILYNNAATTSFLSVAEMTDDELDRVLAVNVKGMFYCCRAALPGMIRNGSGVILNNASITGLVGAPGMTAYAASKGAVIAFTRSLALEQAENNLRVNCICPASVDTPMLQASFDRTGDPARARERNIRRHPLGRLATPDDVANLALFLVSDEASFITGGTYVIDGGASIARRWRE